MTIPSATLALGATLPQNTGSGYVAAAYIVFLAIVLVYVSIMSLRLHRVERALRDLRTRADRDRASAASDERPADRRGEIPAEHAREREAV
jgi:uncharacterized membrane protein